MTDTSMNQPTLCICPKCGVEHTRRIFWTGDFIPRKFCEDCDSLKDLDTECCGVSCGHLIKKRPADQDSIQSQ